MDASGWVLQASAVTSIKHLTHNSFLIMELIGFSQDIWKQFFHLNVTVVYLTREHWGWTPPPPHQTGPGCQRHRRAEQELSVWTFSTRFETATSVQGTYPPPPFFLWRFAVWNNLLVMWLDFLLWPCVYNSASIRCRARDMRLGASLRANPVFPHHRAQSFVRGVILQFFSNKLVASGSNLRSS